MLPGAFLVSYLSDLPLDWHTARPLPAYEGLIAIYSHAGVGGALFRTWLEDGERHYRAMPTPQEEETYNVPETSLER